MSIVPILLCLLFAASVLCAVTIVACAVGGGTSLSPDLNEEPLEWHSSPDKPAPVDTVAPHRTQAM